LRHGLSRALSKPVYEMETSVLSLKFLVKIAKGQTQILRLTTPKLKGVWGPFRSG